MASLTDDCRALDAISLWADDEPYVFLTRHKSPERARWDAAHELGHLCLHLGVPPQGREQEREADEFAREFLLPEMGVRGSAPRYPSLAEIRQEKVVWRVSALAYIRRLEQLEFLSEWQYRSLVIEASQAGYRRAEGDIEREVSQLIPKVLGLLKDEDQVTVADIAADLEIGAGELRSLLFFPVGVLEGGAEGDARGKTTRGRHLRSVES